MYFTQSKPLRTPPLQKPYFGGFILGTQNVVLNDQKSYLELENQFSESTLFSSTFKFEENNVPSEN